MGQAQRLQVLASAMGRGAAAQIAASQLLSDFTTTSM